MLTAIQVILYWVTTGSASPTAGALTEKFRAVARWSTVRFGRPQVQIQIGGQHVVEQAGHGTSREFNVELSVGGKTTGTSDRSRCYPPACNGHHAGTRFGNGYMGNDNR